MIYYILNFLLAPSSQLAMVNNVKSRFIFEIFWIEHLIFLILFLVPWDSQTILMNIAIKINSEKSAFKNFLEYIHSNQTTFIPYYRTIIKNLKLFLKSRVFLKNTIK